MTEAEKRNIKAELLRLESLQEDILLSKKGGYALKNHRKIESLRKMLEGRK